MTTPKFRPGQIVRSNAEFTEEIFGRVQKDGERTTKNKKGESIFETYSYFVVDAAGTIYYFLEAELK
jgi:hypothetical protein